MRRALASVLFASAVAATIGCGATHKSFVRVDDVALGRVVVYRNGVAFYERHAFVKRGAGLAAGAVGGQFGVNHPGAGGLGLAGGGLCHGTQL